MDKVKKVARWGGPAAALLALYGATTGIPSLPLAALLVGAGLVLSWGVPKLVDFVKSKLG